MVIYSALRLAIFAVLFLVLSLLNLGHWVVTAILAAVLAFLVSYLVLRGPRERAAQYLADRAARRKATGEKFSREIEDDAAFEDAAVDEAEAASPAGSPGSVGPADAESLRRTGDARPS